MRKFIISAICIALVAVAVVGAIAFIKTAPKAERKRPPKMAPLVKTLNLKADDETIVLKLTGTVVPAEEVQLRARVGGEIVSMSPDFIDGGLLKKGAEALRIDPVDYELALADAESKLEKARFDYKLELGRQDVAKREWELLKTEDATDLEKELTLRIPHLAASWASLKAAESSLEKAELNLSRTQVRAPFDAVVLERRINLGSQVTLQDVLGRLVGTDAYWVQVSIPVDRLRWIEVPGSQARIVSTSGAVREGTVIKILGDLEEKGRMARLLIEIRNPFDGNLPILLGEYVRTEISGSKLEKVYTIPRDALRENSSIWIAKDGKLDIRPVEVIWRDPNQVIIQDNIFDGELLIVSDLTTPIKDMDVNTGNGKSGDEAQGKKPANKE